MREGGGGVNADDKKNLPFWGIMLIMFSYLILPFIYYLFRQNNFKLIDFYALSAVLLFLIVGAYQIYFYPQKYHKNNTNIIEIPETYIDKQIPKLTWSVYIYNFVYYIGFGLLLIFIKSYKEFIYTCFRALLLLVTLFLFFMVFPYKLNDNTRDKGEKNIFLNLTQSCDGLTNAFPSAHVAIAVYISVVLKKYIGNIAFIFPILIFISCLLTKQHFFIDCVGGACWGSIYSSIVL